MEPQKFSHTAEDDPLRSAYVRNLVQSPMVSPLTTSEPKIPKVLVQFWNDLNNLPEDVEECLNTWSCLKAEGFEQFLFDDIKARIFIGDHFGSTHLRAFDLCIHPAMRCDYFRLCYLWKRGGFYVDSDEEYFGHGCDQFFLDNRIKLQPLCYDLTDGSMIPYKVFAEESEFSPSWIFYVNNNPIIAPPRHPLIRLALERATRLVVESTNRSDIQSITGPGNLSASLVEYSIRSKETGQPFDFEFLASWEMTAASKWPLSYRNDDRNWRLWISKEDSKG